MSSKEIIVSIALGSENYLVGKLWCHTRKGRESASFEQFARAIPLLQSRVKRAHFLILSEGSGVLWFSIYDLITLRLAPPQETTQ